MTSRNISFTSLAKETREIDAFICSSSFEERSSSVAQALGRNVANVFICEQNLSGRPSTKYSKTLFRLFPASNKIELSISNPLVSADSMDSMLEDLSKSNVASVLVDITTFTHETLLILLKLISLRLNKGWNPRIRFVYTGAADYSLGQSRGEKWLSKGIGEVRSVLGYPGRVSPSKKRHLIVLAGFESDRAEQLILSYEPTILSLGLGEQQSSVSPEHYETNQEFFVRLATRFRNVESFDFSCTDAVDAMKAVEKQALKHKDFNVFVSPLNTKISTVGVGLAAMRNDSIQICYATALKYNETGYSTPRQDCFLFEIPLT
jgi:hypothetical protein